MKRFRFLLCLLLFVGPPAARADPPAGAPEAMVARAIEAMGGRKAMEKSTDMEMLEGDLELFLPLQNKAHFLAWHKGRKLLMEVHAGGLTAKVCFNGANGWKEVLGSVSDLSTEEKGEHEVSSEHDTDLLLKVGKPGYQVAALEKRKLPDGFEAEGVRITPPKGTPTDLFFDPATGLPAALGYQGRDFLRGVDAAFLLRMLDYRRLDGVMVSFTQKQYEDGQLGQAITITRADLTTPIADSLFERPHRALAAGKAVTVPFDFSTGELLISATLNGGPPRKFILDSGAAVSVLLPDVAKELNLEARGEMTAGAGGGGVKAKMARLPSVEVGGAAAKDLDVAVVDAGPLTTALGSGVAGLLGANFLSRFQVTLDYGTHKLTLAPPSSPPPAGRHERMEVFSGIPVVSASTAGRRFRMYVDTGAQMTTLPPRLAASLRVGRTRPMFGMGADGRPLRLQAARLPSLTAAGGTVRDLVVAFSRPTGITGGMLGDWANGLLGNTFLRRFRITLDYARQQITLVPVAERSAASDQWTSPGLELEGGPFAHVAEVLPNTPAARAGLRRDDTVVRIDGRTTWKESTLDLQRRLRGRPNSYVRVTVLRNGRRRTYLLRRVRLI